MFWKEILWLQTGANGGLSLAAKRTLKLHRYRSLLGKLHTATCLDRVLKNFISKTGIILKYFSLSAWSLYTRVNYDNINTKYKHE
jgi:hypothetical protein